MIIGEIKDLIRLVYKKAYEDGFKDGENDRWFCYEEYINIEIENILFNNNIYLYEEFKI